MAGAHAVVGSLWSVEDQATSRLMSELYTGLLGRDLSPADALRAAQLAFADFRGFGALYHWAGFSIEGVGRGDPSR